MVDLCLTGLKFNIPSWMQQEENKCSLKRTAVTTISSDVVLRFSDVVLRFSSVLHLRDFIRRFDQVLPEIERVILIVKLESQKVKNFH